MRIAVGLASALAARGHAVHLFARTPPLGLRRFGPGVTFHSLRGGSEEPPNHSLQADWSPSELDSFLELLLSVVRSARLDVLHFHYGVPFVELAARVRGRLGPACPRLAVTLHGTDVSTFGLHPELGPTLSRKLEELDALTTVSESYATLAKKTFGLPHRPQVIQNFIDLRRFHPWRVPARPAFPRFRRRLTIVHVSNFRPVKDPESLARVFVRVRHQLDSELWLVGDGDRMGAVRSILREAQVERHVRFLGVRREVQRILPRADLMLLSSRTESFCLAALEAAACGVPVVAPRVGGLPEVVEDGKTGLLFDRGDEDEAADGVLRLLGDAALRSSMAQSALQRARHFSSEVVVPRYEDLYRGLLNGSAVTERPALTTEFAPAGV